MTTSANIGEIFHDACRQIGDTDARTLCCEVLNLSGIDLLTLQQDKISEDNRKKVSELVKRRKKGEPIAYLLGKRDFYGFEFTVNPSTLIPRPDTETMVIVAQDLVDHNSHVLDLGTGCGTIGISLAIVTGCRVTLTDSSCKALEVARANADKHGVNAEFMCSDWFEDLTVQPQFDLIVSNPPYIASDDRHLGEGDLRFEPKQALDGGTDGLSSLRSIVKNASGYLQEGGTLAVEHGYQQSREVFELFERAGFTDIQLIHDLNNLPRVTTGRTK